MIQKRLLFSLLIPCLSFLMFRCANPVSPEGGKKDVIPPRLVQADPPDHTVRFTAKEIHLEFDEFFNLKDPSTQIIVAPPSLPATDFRIRGKSVVIDLKEPLLANTTYTINFGNSIQDIAENNTLKDFRYVFSTGDFIDSLSLNGTVVSAFDLTVQKDILAMLYLDNNDTIPFDSLPYQVKPYYIARTNEQGEFFFTNLTDQSMLLFGLQDLNGNSIYDQPTEKIAFFDSLVRGSYTPPPDTAVKDTTVKHDTVAGKDSIRPDTAKVNQTKFSRYTLKLFQEADTVQKLMKKESPHEGQYALYFRNPLKNGRFALLNAKDTGIFIPEYSSHRDTIYLWLTRQQEDTLRFVVTQNGIATDTVAFPYVKVKKSKQASRLSVLSNMSDGFLNQFRTEPQFIFSYPLRSADLERLRLSDGKDTVSVKATFADSIHRRLVVHYGWKEKTNYTLIIPDSIFYGYNGLTNDSINISIKSRALSDLGSLAIETSSEKPSLNYIFQLLTDKEKIVEEQPMKKPGKIRFDFLSPGSYKIKVILDRNNNGKWDPGIYTRKIQPETVLYYPGTIEIRSNWDVEEKWDF